MGSFKRVALSGRRAMAAYLSFPALAPTTAPTPAEQLDANADTVAAVRQRLETPTRVSAAVTTLRAGQIGRYEPDDLSKIANLVPGETQPAPMLQSGAQWRLVVALTIVSTLAMIDKNLIQLMVEPIKHDLGLTDVQISVLLGAAFALANIGAGLPAGWLADRFSRKWLIGSGVVVWSLATAGSGMASSFGWLFAARAKVGFGEGIIPPACYSLLRGEVSPERRGRALALYTTALTTGAGLALIVCGALIAFITTHAMNTVPLIGTVHPWQMALFMIGCTGLPIVLLVFTLPVGRRIQPGQTDSSTYRDALVFMRQHGAILGPLLLYSIAFTMLMATMGAWVPALIGRKFGLAPQELGPILGVMLFVCGPTGLVVVGWFTDRFNAVGKPGSAIVGIVTASCFGIAGAIMPQVNSLPIFWCVEVLVLLTTTPFLSVTAEIVGRETPPHMVGKVMAIFLLLQGLVGLALAPTLTALLSQHLYAGRPNALGDAISTSSVFCGVVGLMMIILTFRNQRMALQRKVEAHNGV